jgi:hypothetical protein
MGNGVSGKWEKYTTASVSENHCKIGIYLSLHFLWEMEFLGNGKNILLFL